MNRRGWAELRGVIGQDAPVHSSRGLTALTAALAVVLATAGCAQSGSGGTTASPTSPSTTAPSTAAPTTDPAAKVDCAESGSASDSVKVTAKGGKAAPDVTFPVPTTATTTQRTVVKDGDGDKVAQGDSVNLAYVLFDAKTGKQADTRGYGGSGAVALTADPAQLLQGLVQVLVCAKEGERFAAVIPASAAFGDAGQAQLGIGKGDSLVMVGDVKSIVPTKAGGKAKALPAGFPKVALAADGKPTVSIPATDPPKSLKIASRQVGSGETVKEGDTVTVQYQGTLWRTGKVFDQSWGKGPTSFATNQVVRGFGQALIGAKVGSQVVAIVPPDDGYGAKGQGEIKGTDTMVFVVDVLSTSHPS